MPDSSAQLTQWIEQRYGKRQAGFLEDIGINKGELSDLVNSMAFGGGSPASIGVASDFGDAWPFWDIPPNEYFRLAANDRRLIEQFAALMISRARVTPHDQG
jgi:hypothetical protein